MDTWCHGRGPDHAGKGPTGESGAVPTLFPLRVIGRPLNIENYGGGRGRPINSPLEFLKTGFSVVPEKVIKPWSYSQ